MPGTFQAVYNGTKAFIDSFSFALRAELKDTGVTVTCLMPGATGNRLLRAGRHAGYEGRQAEKDDPADVARVGFDAMMRGDGDVVSGWKNKLQSAIANVTPARRAGGTAPPDGGTGVRKSTEGMTSRSRNDAKCAVSRPDPISHL